MTFNENGTSNIRYVWSVLCNSSILDAGTQNLTINNVVDSVSINIGKEMVEYKSVNKTKAYAVPLQLHVVTKLVRKNQDKDLKIDIKFEELNPDGELLSPGGVQTVELPKQFKNIRLRNNFTPFLLDKSGTYTIRVLLKESDEKDFTEVDRIPLDVSIAEAQKIPTY